MVETAVCRLTVLSPGCSGGGNFGSCARLAGRSSVLVIEAFDVIPLRAADEREAARFGDARKCGLMYSQSYRRGDALGTCDGALMRRFGHGESRDSSGVDAEGVVVGDKRACRRAIQIETRMNSALQCMSMPKELRESSWRSLA